MSRNGRVVATRHWKINGVAVRVDLRLVDYSDRRGGKILGTLANLSVLALPAPSGARTKSKSRTQRPS